MAGKVLVNLTTGMEDGEKVTVAFLVAGAALERGSEVAMFLTKEAVRLAVPGTAEGTFCEGCPPLERIFDQFVQGGGELWHARSASTRANSTPTGSSPTPVSRAPRRCSSG